MTVILIPEITCINLLVSEIMLHDVYAVHADSQDKVCKVIGRYLLLVG